jgi:tRNA (adenine22-N1)-methyltransferase
MQLDVRLGAAAALVPIGARLADIGSDHAYLPIALCLENKIECALASDINEGPVSAARSNVAKNRLSEKIAVKRADGLDGAEDFAPDCITVLGMGGELITSILDKAKWIRSKEITLVLQPMTHAEILARYLAENGFAILDERIVCDGGRDDRIYRIIKARYNGAAQELGELEALIGRANLDRGDEVTRALVEKNIRVLQTRIDGKARSGADSERERSLVEEMKTYLETKNEGN